MGDRSWLTLRAEQGEWNALLADERHELIRRVRPDPVGELAFPRFDFLDAQFPGHVDCGPAIWREHVGRRIQDQLVLLAERLYVVLHHKAAADGLDVDGHPLAIRCGREA